MSGRRLDAARGCLIGTLAGLALWLGAFLLAHLVVNGGWAP